MCGVDSDLDDGGVGDDERDQEDEFAMAEGVRMLPPPTAHCEGSVWGGRRSRCGCLVFGTWLVLWNVGLAVTCVILLASVFAVVLLPAALLLYAGFLCHSRVMASPSALCRYLDDNSCSALIILGFVMMSPLVVVAAATFCGLLRRLRLLWLFQPISGAWFRGRSFGWSGDLRAWV
ncbi:transmembrane protein 88 [Sardina pilchardus]|uniref:transmembrane protein 88 n=1 Tax=Sardina pilchardus TaxID=27697 RepID=UPI002E1049B7